MKKNKKGVLVLKYYTTYGGAENQINFLIDHLFSKSRSVYQTSRVIKRDNFRILNLFIIFFKSLLYIKKVDFLFYYNLYFFPIALFFKILGIKVIYSERILSDKTKKRELIYKYLLAEDMCVVNSLATKDYFLSEFNKKKVYFIPNSIPSIKFMRHEQKNESPLMLAIISRLSPEKAILETIKGLKIKRDALINIYFTSYDDDYKNKIESIICKLDLKVNLAGKSSLAKIFSENHLVIHPSYHEGTSNVILECCKNNYPFFCRNIEQNRVLGLDQEIMFNSENGLSKLIENYSFYNYEIKHFKKNKECVGNYKRMSELNQLINALQ